MGTSESPVDRGGIAPDPQPSFLWGMGGVVAVLIGVCFGLLLAFVVEGVCAYLDGALASMGAPSRVRALIQFALAVAVWVGYLCVAFGNGRQVTGYRNRMDDLRRGVGSWVTVLHAALDVLPLGLLVPLFWFPGRTELEAQYPSAAMWFLGFTLVTYLGAWVLSSRRARVEASQLGGRRPNKRIERSPQG